MELMNDAEKVAEVIEALIREGEKVDRSDYQSCKVWKHHVIDALQEHFVHQEPEQEFEEHFGLKVTAARMGGGVTNFRENLPRAIKYLKILSSEVIRVQTDSDRKEEEAMGDMSINGNHVFVVHGHDEAIREKVSNLVEKFGLAPIILNEKPNMGKTIIEKIEQYGDVKFAVVLFTPDDLGESKEVAEKGNLEQRPRQNVLLELGYFWGRLGRDRVCLLNSVGDNLSSDLKGIGYTNIDKGGAWKMELAKELKAAGFDVDASVLIN